MRARRPRSQGHLLRVVALVAMLASAWSSEPAFVTPTNSGPTSATSTNSAPTTSTAVQQQAANDLADARQRMLRQRTELAAQLQAAAAEAQSAHERLAQARQAKATAMAELAKQKREQDQAAAVVRLLVDQAVLASGVDPSAVRAKPALEQVAAAVQTVEARITRLGGDLPLRRSEETIAGRDGIPGTTPVLRLGAARAIALGSEPRVRGLLQPSAATGTGRADSAAAAINLALVTGPWFEVPAGHIALDPDGRAVATVAHGWSLAGWIAGGRMFIWPILIVLALGLGLALVRLVDLLRSDRRTASNQDLPTQAATLAVAGQSEAAVALIQGRDDAMASLVRAALATRGQDRLAREAALEGVLIQANAALHRHLPTILVLAGVAPLLGLLGTVTGMIDMFAVIAGQGASDARSLSGAISEALITTQAGMVAAIPLLLVHAGIHRLVDARVTELERGACTLLGIATDMPVGDET